MDNPAFFLLFLFGTSLLNGTSTALNRLGRSYVEKLLKERSSLKAIRAYLEFFFGERIWEGLFFSLSLTKQLMQLCYALFFFLFLVSIEPFSQALHSAEKAWDIIWLLLIAGIIIGVSLATNFIINLISLASPKKYLGFATPFSAALLLIFSLINAPLFKILGLFLPKAPTLRKLEPDVDMRNKFLEVLQDSDLAPYFDQSDQKLLSSVVSFKERIAREVMVPRIDIFSLPIDTSLQEATESFLLQGYSRIPIYRESVDNIVGVLLFKDILKHYFQASTDKEKDKKLKNSIEDFLKPVLYTPETKKISQLFQEFRSKQIHLAIVVDEWGGTEGIITIEDILEELVGEIADEYDIDEEIMFSVLPGGGWIVDGKMSILDIEGELGIKIPQNPEYDTLGGYIVHRAGTIPSKGWKIHHDEFDLEVLSSDERSVDKIRITSLTPKEN
ncbi:MAG: HlyC/CorC family transporter [Chlamydiales bacterium]|nr:HlyC/CorC family transporter [Chlamydiales bacterium]